MGDNSKCSRNFLCDYRTILDNDEVRIERCNFCKKVVRYNKRGGRLDEKQYLYDHRRHFVQPFGKTHKEFLQIYGYKAAEAIKKYALKQIELGDENKRQERYEEVAHGAMLEIKRDRVVIR